MEEIKWLYIRLIGQMSNEYGNKLYDLMTRYSCSNLQEVTDEQAKEFYEELLSSKKNNIKYERRIWSKR